MDEIILAKIQEKISESIADKKEIMEILSALNMYDSNDFKMGILIGRVYNSFHYQTKRILKREPTKLEFSEFLEFLIKNKKSLEKKIDSL